MTLRDDENTYRRKGSCLMKRCKHCRREVRWLRVRVGPCSKGEPIGRLCACLSPKLLHDWNFSEWCGMGRETKAEIDTQEKNVKGKTDAQ